jgi:hypothetical protein
MPKNQRPLVAAVLHYDRIEDWDGRGNPGKFSVAIADREHIEKFLPTIAGWKYRDLVEVVEDPRRLARIFHDRGLGLDKFDAKLDDDQGTDFAQAAREELARLLARVEDEGPPELWTLLGIRPT